MNHFRTTAKHRTDVMLPVKLDDRLRTVRGRRSISWVVSAALCEYFGLDPADFGLNADQAGQRATDTGAPATAEK